jgi:hypothetical protein
LFFLFPFFEDEVDGVEWVYPRNSAAERCQETGEKSEAWAASTAVLPGDSVSMYSSILQRQDGQRGALDRLARTREVEGVVVPDVRRGMISELEYPKRGRCAR